LSGQTTRLEGAKRAVTTESIRVLVVDDDERFAGLVHSLLERDDRFEFAGWAPNGAEACRLVARKQPHVITMDLEMPVCDGVEAIRLINAYDASTPIVVLSGSNSSDKLDAALAAGAVAHVAKARVGDELLAALVAAERRGRRRVGTGALSRAGKAH
jgi:two-component system NarL family response regulator